MILRGYQAIFSVLAVSARYAADDPTRIAFDVPRDAVVMGEDIARTDWAARLASPSREGQFEVLVRKTAAPLDAPGCKSQYLVVRMPGSVAVGRDLTVQAAVGQKLAFFDRMMQLYTNGQRMHFEVFAGPYGHRAASGRIVLTGCNLFFVEPAAEGP